MFLSFLTLQKITFMLFDIVHKILKETQTRRISSFSNSKSKHGYIFFCRRTHEQKKHGFTFLESMKVQKIRIESFCKLKMLRHAQIQSVKTAKCFRKRQSHFLQTQTVQKCSFRQNVFPKEWGQALCACVGPLGPPHFLGKTFLLKRTFVYPSRL